MNPRRLSLLAALCIGHTAMPARAQTDTLSVSVIGSDITTLDPVRVTTTTDLVPVGWIYNALVRFAPGSSDPKTLEPDLAESWEVSDNDRARVRTHF